MMSMLASLDINIYIYIYICIGCHKAIVVINGGHIVFMIVYIYIYIYIYLYIYIYNIYISIYIYIYRELICFFLKQSVNIGVGNTLDIFCHYEFCGLNNILTFESLIFKSIK